MQICRGLRNQLINLAYYCGGEKILSPPRFQHSGASAPVASAIPTPLLSDKRICRGREFQLLGEDTKKFPKLADTCLIKTMDSLYVNHQAVANTLGDGYEEVTKVIFSVGYLLPRLIVETRASLVKKDYCNALSSWCRFFLAVQEATAAGGTIDKAAGRLRQLASEAREDRTAVKGGNVRYQGGSEATGATDGPSSEGWAAVSAPC